MTDKLSVDEAFALLPWVEANKAVDFMASKISREYLGLVAAEDLTSVFWVWFAEHPKKAGDWNFVNDKGEAKFGWKSFRRDAGSVMAKYCRTEKAKHGGYEVEDEQFYGRQQVLDLLQFVWHSEIDVHQTDQAERVSGKKDPSQGGDLLASIWDVRRAYKIVVGHGGTWDKILMAMYAFGLTQDEVASELKMNQATVSRHHQRALDALMLELNGTRPYKEPGTGRKAVTNARALALVSEQEHG